jgi:hypothetical protein
MIAHQKQGGRGCDPGPFVFSCPQTALASRIAVKNDRILENELTSRRAFHV